MKLTIERAALLKTLAHVQSVVERRNTIPILSNVLIDAGDGELSLTATDMDLTIVETVAAEVATAFPEGLGMILDGGPATGGAASTILDLSTDPPRMLREGRLPLSALRPFVRAVR